VTDFEHTSVLPPSAVALATGTAVIVAGNEETRVLLRGLVRLQHFHVVGEAEGSTDGVKLLHEHRPELVLIETGLVEGSAATLVQTAHALLPTARVVVVGSLDPQGGAAPHGERITYLRKPFRIAEFAHAIGRELPPH
jgi:DNA-binding NarL/FixJ family response regulator